MPSAARRFVLADYCVERRESGWYFGSLPDPMRTYRGPYLTTASVSLMIARELRREIERRDARMPSDRAPT